ncbi:MAG: SIMPL domain-containing protein [Ignavibacteria bacterium]|nr:SIMPL domain-containing protein [Ignavibacteria bacterium]
MKKIPLTALFIFILFTSIVKVNAQVEPLSLIELQGQCKPPVIEVFGTAIIKVVPDKMNWSVNVQVDMDDVKEAKYQHDKSVSKVLNILEEEGILSKNIQTSGVRINKRLNPYYNNEKKYGVTNNIWFTVSDIEKYDRLSEKLTEIDDVYINNITLESTKAIETREQARTDALIAAKDKAEKMAETLGMSIGEPLLIREQATSYYPNPYNSISDMGTRGFTDMESTFSEGTINISASVMVTFKLISKY